MLELKDMTTSQKIAFMEQHKKANGDYNFSQALKSLGKRSDDKSAMFSLLKALTPKTKLDKMQKENKAINEELKQTKEKLEFSDNIKQLIANTLAELSGATFDDIPEWINDVPKTQLVPVLKLTDIHDGETIIPEEVNFANEYNSDIAEERTNQVVDDFISICKVNLSNYEYPGMVLALGGDNITGNLHDLAETNDLTPIQQVIHCTKLIAQQIYKLKQAFGNVCIVAVTGNHGRLSYRRTKTKRRSFDSLETLIYANIAAMFKDDENITISYNQSDFILFTINGHRFRLEHGDRFKGGGGIGGIEVPIKRGIAKIRQVAIATKQEFDTLMIGHFHLHLITGGLIIGASIKGYDEYCRDILLPYSDPGATMFFVNEHSEIIFGMPIICRDKQSKKAEQGVKVW